MDPDAALTLFALVDVLDLEPLRGRAFFIELIINNVIFSKITEQTPSGI